VACLLNECEKLLQELATEFGSPHLNMSMPDIKISMGPNRKVDTKAMSRLPLKFMLIISAMAACAPHANAGDVLKITIPRHSELTPVQKLNREGVEAVRKQDYEKASTIFYKAYLYDPGDPFTLNNLGYVSELQGELDRAHKFYTLAAEQGSNANIDRSSTKELVNQPMQSAFQNLQEGPMKTNRMNLDAMSLLAANRGFEAVTMLQKALASDPKNPFTLNNLGVADESIGDFENALNYYGQAAASNVKETVVVTQDRSWRGKSISNMAAFSFSRLQQRIKNMDSAEQQAAKLTLHGVAAANQNNLAIAKEDFLHAYTLNPNSAFTLNNRGFVAEMEGDLESAEYFYDKARKAPDANVQVGMATQHLADGQRLNGVATNSDQKVGTELDRYSQERRRESGSIELVPRQNQPPTSQSPH
jgi:Flp pilus assembly protein TadD